MKRPTKEQYEARAEVAKALAHPSRLLLLDVLAEGPRCVSELTELVGDDQSTVSKHLAVLRNVGLVDVDKEGTQCRYRVCCSCLDRFFVCLESVVKSKLKWHQARCACK
jgi:ArsR family transcriptional regulator